MKNFLTKVAQIFGDHFGAIVKTSLKGKNRYGNFWEILGYFFILTSGRTVPSKALITGATPGLISSNDQSFFVEK